MKKWKKKRMVAVLLTLLVLLQFPADFGSVAHAARKKEIRGTISVASNISQQDMQQYLDGFNKKYPGIEVKYQSYSDYDNEVSKQIQGGDYPDVLFVPGSVPGEKYADYFEKLGTKKEIVMLIMRDRNRLAKTDALTGLYNRYGLSEELNRIYDRKELPLLFAIMDIDNFKSVNDTLGHAGGDEALKLLADTMRLVFGTHVLMARFGGDEFVLCIQNRDQESVQAQLDKLVRSMCQTFTYGGGSVPLSISLGAVYMTEKVPYEKLFKEADSVLYDVKTRGKNSFEVRTM